MLLLLSACDPDYWGLGFQDFYGAPLGWEAGADALPVDVAVVVSAVDQDPDVNVERMLAVLDDIAASAPETRLVLFGETILGWYYDAEDPLGYQQTVAQTVPGPATDAIGDWALEHGWTVAFGLAEDREGILHNSMVVLGTDGQVAAVHTKVNLTDWDVENGYVPGEGPTLLQWGDLSVGLMICSDLESRSVITSMSDLAPDLVLLPLASGMGSDIDPTARQLETWVLTANRFGDEDGIPYDGAAWISNPAGSHAVASTGSATWISTRVEVAR